MPGKLFLLATGALIIATACTGAATTAATATGMLPIVGLYVYLGTLAKDMGQVLSGGADAGTPNWWIAGIAASAITIVVVIVRRTVRRVLERSLRTRAEDTHRVN